MVGCGIQKEKVKNLGGEGSGMEGSLRDAKEDSQVLSSALSSLWNWKGEEEKEEGRFRWRECSGIALWFALHSLVCWWSLVAC